MALIPLDENIYKARVAEQYGVILCQTEGCIEKVTNVLCCICEMPIKRFCAKCMPERCLICNSCHGICRHNALDHILAKYQPDLNPENLHKICFPDDVTGIVWNKLKIIYEVLYMPKDCNITDFIKKLRFGPLYIVDIIIDKSKWPILFKTNGDDFYQTLSRTNPEKTITPFNIRAAIYAAIFRYA